MTRHHRSPDPSPSSATAAIAPPILVSLMEAFRGFFTAPVWDHVLVLMTGVVLTPGKRTVSAALRIMGLSEASDFALYHHVLSQARWDSRAITHKLLTMILDRFLSAGALIIGIDDTIERRWGARIAARGIYRDPVRSSHGHFVKASGLRWLSFMIMIPLP
jgi:DDE superfamily endonuclease